MLKLKKFKVTDFRSVKDSGWIETNDTTSLIGINESGKSNLMLPLWKFNPAKGGEIHPVSDYPRSMYNDTRNEEEKPIFIEACFELPLELSKKIGKLTNTSVNDVDVVSVSKNYDNEFFIEFPNFQAKTNVDTQIIIAELEKTKIDIESLSPANQTTEVQLKEQVIATLSESLEHIKKLNSPKISKDSLNTINQKIKNINTEKSSTRSTIVPRLNQLNDKLEEQVTQMNQPSPDSFEEVEELILSNLPKFVYYSNYGNLDSEIYLPHVIQNMARKDLGPKEEAKARTLKVLFDFVGLEPEEILKLGQEVANANPTQLQQIAENKRERDVLLQSASSKLTKAFRDWWKQGDYRFRFAADGNHFRIWVSDDKRPDDIELEGRSTGLQWFLSFFLVFLVEAKDSHEGSILLLDEPGLTLHPLAQKDLSNFFDSLSKSNQLIFSTHSPFLIDSDRLDQVRAVFLDESGNTVCSADLRGASSKSVRDKSIYAAHAALGLTISDVILQGCQPIIVEGTSDQTYLSAIKNTLIGKGLINPKQEIVFMPSGGSKAIKALASILSIRDNDLPFVLLDSDRNGKELATNLKANTYSHQPHKIILIGDILNADNTEIEDLIPGQIIASEFSKLFKSVDTEFEEVVTSQPIVNQMEDFAKNNNISLTEGWKVDLAKQVKKKFDFHIKDLKDDSPEMSNWVQLFGAFDNVAKSSNIGQKSL